MGFSVDETKPGTTEEEQQQHLWIRHYWRYSLRFHHCPGMGKIHEFGVVATLGQAED